MHSIGFYIGLSIVIIFIIIFTIVLYRIFWLGSESITNDIYETLYLYGFMNGPMQ